MYILSSTVTALMASLHVMFLLAPVVLVIVPNTDELTYHLSLTKCRTLTHVYTYMYVTHIQSYM